MSVGGIHFNKVQKEKNLIYSHLKTPYIDIQRCKLDSTIVKLIPKTVAEQHKLIAIDKMDNILTVGLTNLEDITILSSLETELNCIIIPYLISLKGWETVFFTAYL